MNRFAAEQITVGPRWMVHHSLSCWDWVRINLGRDGLRTCCLQRPDTSRAELLEPKDSAPAVTGRGITSGGLHVCGIPIPNCGNPFPAATGSGISISI
jgi:hypothetical protein